MWKNKPKNAKRVFKILDSRLKFDQQDFKN
jgi:hypothetical protein